NAEPALALQGHRALVEEAGAGHGAVTAQELLVAQGQLAELRAAGRDVLKRGHGHLPVLTAGLGPRPVHLGQRAEASGQIPPTSYLQPTAPPGASRHEVGVYPCRLATPGGLSPGAPKHCLTNGR